MLGAAMIVGALAAALAVGAAPAAADQHEPENAPTFNDSNPKVTFEITLPHTTDHYPGNHPVHSEQNGYNASIEYAAAGQEAFKDFDAEEGVWIDFIELGAGWIDYSECDATQNTKVFGIDRDNDNEGTRADEDLIEHRRGSELSAGGLTVTFFDWSDLSGDPPYLAPEDAVVAAQGAGSNDGPCLKMTGEPGWYQVTGYANATIATECTEEGNPQCEPEDTQWRGVNLRSNYVYICECDGEGAAREQLGPPPNEDPGDGDSDDAATPTPTSDGGAATATATPATVTPDRTPTPEQATATATTTRTASSSDASTARATEAVGDAGRNVGVDRHTPTVAQGPGFTPLVALLAVAAAAALAVRRP
jgi:PGF-CTERM protein